MTHAQLVEAVRELAALERLRVAVEAQMMQPGASDAWRYALTAFDDRCRWVRYGLSVADPAAVAMAEEVVRASAEHVARPSASERLQASVDATTAPATMPDPPAGARVH